MPRSRPTPVVQFGTSRFLQAHADLFIHEAGAGPVTIVAASGSAAGRARLAAFNDPAGYRVIIRGMANGRRIDRQVNVRSVTRGIDAIADWRELNRIVIDEARFIISNTTEAGFGVGQDQTIDLAGPLDDAPDGFPARLLSLLAARFSKGRDGLVILPTELLGRNGDTLKRTILAMAARSQGADVLLQWIDEQCVFANSLVDRIVSTPLEPAGAIAEPYALWAIEAQPRLETPCDHPSIVIVADLEPVERLKLHILNLGHTFLAQEWRDKRMSDKITVGAMLADAETRRSLTDLYRQEVVPGFASRGMADAASAYVVTTLDRFDNPFLDHRLSDIASGHDKKVESRIGGFVKWVAEAGGPPIPRLSALLASHTKELVA